MSRPEQSTQNDNVELGLESTAPLSTINKLVEDNSTYNVRIDQKEGRLMTCARGQIGQMQAGDIIHST